MAARAIRKAASWDSPFIVTLQLTAGGSMPSAALTSFNVASATAPARSYPI